MAKLKGQYLKVQVDDSAGTLRDVSTDVDSADIPDEFGEIDVTGFTEGAVNSIPGMPNFPVELSGTFNPAATTGFYTVIKGIVGQMASKTLTIDVPTGTTPTTGDPRFTGEFWCQKMGVSTTPTGKAVLTASFRVFGSVAPGWTTVP